MARKTLEGHHLTLWPTGEYPYQNSEEGPKMRTLSEYNKQMQELWKEREEKAKKTGLACDECGTELLFTGQQNFKGLQVECPKCDFQDFLLSL